MTGHALIGPIAGHAHAFVGPWQAFIDSVRVADLVILATLAVWAVADLVRGRRPTRWQVVTAAAVALCGTAIGETEYVRIGSQVGQGGRLWLNTGAALLLVLLVWNEQWARR